MTKSSAKTKGRNKAVIRGDYQRFLNSLKTRIKSAQIKASVAVNRELINLYWNIGRDIARKQEIEGWGKSVVQKLARDLKKEFPKLKGFSPQNMWYMRAFYLAWSQNIQILQQLVGEFDEANFPQFVGEIPWGHNIVLFEKIKDIKKRVWYAHKIIENGWSRAVFLHQIESRLFERQAKTKKITNFSNTLPDNQSDLAHEILKDPYNFGFLSLTDKIKEKELHIGLVNNLREFLVELGIGFSFVGSEYHICVGDQDFYIDLLFYHLKLRCFVVVELKTVAFQPEFAGKMNFYLSAIDAQLRHVDDRPAIGIILCKSKNKTIVEYALRDANKPMGVSGYRLVDSVPKVLKGDLPSLKDLKKGL